MRIGRLRIVRPHRARHWWSGICFEWGGHGTPRAGDQPAHFVRIYLQ